VTADLAFISLCLVLPTISDLLGSGSAASDGRDVGPGGEALCLVKPQFEAGRADVGKHGVVRSPEVWRRVLREVVEAAEPYGLLARGLWPSPIRGPEGNVEFLLWLGRIDPGNEPARTRVGASQIDAAIETALSRPPHTGPTNESGPRSERSRAYDAGL
jgi:23S rRNA (cytidine1920-2'-O)/16S rRNA (cytidine1409-2'-O)-methyltransferase